MKNQIAPISFLSSFLVAPLCSTGSTALGRLKSISGLNLIFCSTFNESFKTVLGLNIEPLFAFACKEKITEQNSMANALNQFIGLGLIVKVIDIAFASKELTAFNRYN